MTRRTRGIALQQLIEDLTPYLIGWHGYFGFCQTPHVLTNLEAWIRRRLRSYLWRQWRKRNARWGSGLDRGACRCHQSSAGEQHQPLHGQHRRLFGRGFLGIGRIEPPGRSFELRPAVARTAPSSVAPGTFNRRRPAAFPAD